MIRVLVCDDHPIVRQAIGRLLDDATDIAVAAEAATAPEALATVRAAAAGAQPLDVVLMDIAMPHRDGLDALRQLRVEFPKLPVLMLSAYPDKQYAVRSLKLGAAGYLNKSADSEQMTGAIRRVVAGGLFVTPAVAEHLAGAIGGGDAAPHDRLSPREYQVLRLLAAGSGAEAIAARLGLAPTVVASYRARILEKTGARNDVELALVALRTDRPLP